MCLFIQAPDQNYEIGPETLIYFRTRQNLKLILIILNLTPVHGPSEPNHQKITVHSSKLQRRNLQ